MTSTATLTESSPRLPRHCAAAASLVECDVIPLRTWAVRGITSHSTLLCLALVGDDDGCRRDVLVVVEDVLRVPLPLDLPQPRVLRRAEARLDPRLTLVAEEVQVRRPGRPRLERTGNALRVLDVALRLRFVFPGGQEVEVERGLA